jgi:hypothetical protein
VKGREREREREKKEKWRETKETLEAYQSILM